MGFDPNDMSEGYDWNRDSYKDLDFGLDEEREEFEELSVIGSIL